MPKSRVWRRTRRVCTSTTHPSSLPRKLRSKHGQRTTKEGRRSSTPATGSTVLPRRCRSFSTSARGRARVRTSSRGWRRRMAGGGGSKFPTHTHTHTHRREREIRECGIGNGLTVDLQVLLRRRAQGGRLVCEYGDKWRGGGRILPQARGAPGAGRVGADVCAGEGVCQILGSGAQERCARVEGASRGECLMLISGD
jgi:hypothetical protein